MINRINTLKFRLYFTMIIDHYIDSTSFNLILILNILMWGFLYLIFDVHLFSLSEFMHYVNIV